MLNHIRNTGTLRVITVKSLNTYYWYENKPIGFEYDLAKAFADYLNVDLSMVVIGWSNMFACMNNKKGDIIAAGLTITKERMSQYNFSIPYMKTQQFLIHHKQNRGPKNIEEFQFKTFHIRRGTSYETRLKEIKNSGVHLKYILHNNISTQDLIARVANQSILFTIADSHIAFLCQRYYPNITIGLPIHKQQSLGWAVRKQDTDLLEAVNRFMIYAKDTGILQQIINKYYLNIHNVDIFDTKKFNKRLKSRFPKYKKMIQKVALQYGFDWRLITAMIYQESHFNPNAQSHTDAKGLMQLTQRTAVEMGINDIFNPSENVRAGIKYLHRMFQNFEFIKDRHQRMLFALASYNVGYGHVFDAVQIAKEKDLKPYQWQSLKKTLPLLAVPEYYRKTKYGYARGWEPVQYVENILKYFDILRHKAIS